MIRACAFALFVAMVIGNTAAAETKRYFERLAVCGGSQAEILSLSEPRSDRICYVSGECQNWNLYQYRVKCRSGRIYDGPAVFRDNPSISRRDLRLEGDRLSVYLGQRVHERPNPNYECMIMRTGYDGVCAYDWESNPTCYQSLGCMGSETIKEHRDVWHPLSAGWAPLPSNVAIQTVDTSAPAPAQRPAAQTAQSAQLSPAPASNSPPRIVAAIPILLLIPAVWFLWIARAGVFRKEEDADTTKQQNMAVAFAFIALIGSAAAGIVGMTDASLLLLVTAVPVTGLWMAVVHFKDFRDGLYAMKTQLPIEDEMQMLAGGTDIVTGDAVNVGVTPRHTTLYDHTRRQQALAEAIKATTDKRGAQSDLSETSAQAVRHQTDLLHAGREHTATVVTEDVEVSAGTVEATADQARRAEEARARLGQAQHTRIEAEHKLEAQERFKEPKMVLGEARIRHRQEQARTEATDSESDRIMSEQARDGIVAEADANFVEDESVRATGDATATEDPNVDDVADTTGDKDMLAFLEGERDAARAANDIVRERYLTGLIEDWLRDQAKKGKGRGHRDGGL